MELASAPLDLMSRMSAQFALIGTPLPPVTAHAWFNTPDSVYHHSPTTRTFADGIVRVFLMGDLYNGNLAQLPILNRVRKWFPGRAEGILLSSSTGHTGPDLVAAATETVWLQRFYLGRRHYTMPIAVWAGDKVPIQVMMTAGTGSYPMPSPTDTAAFANSFGAFVLVDGHGIIRGAMDAETRADEVILRRRIARLVAEMSSPDSLQGAGH